MRPPLKNYSTIYKITCKATGLSYVGQSRDFDRRKNEYIREHKNKDNYLFFSDMRIFGIKNFTFNTIETCDPSIANSREQFWIKEFNTQIPNGYNFSKGGNSWAWKNPEEVKRKISEKSMGRKFSEETLKKLKIRSAGGK